MSKFANFRRFFADKIIGITPNFFGLMLIGAFFFAFGSIQINAASFNVITTADSGAGSLRQAILDANAAAGADAINVMISNGTINLVSPLPVITGTVSIINQDVGSGRVELNGLATQIFGSTSIGFDIQAANCEIRGFTINRFNEAGIRVGVGGDGTKIHQNYIGTSKDGSSVNCPDSAHPCGNINRGIWVYGAQGVLIGTSGPSGLPNSISGNLGRGIVISGATVGSTFYNGAATVQNNFIGTDSAGNNNLGNGQDGILIAGGSGSQIGGAVSGVATRNVIVHNGGNGIIIVADVNFPASNNVIKGNYIGYTLGSNAAGPNKGSGIALQGGNNVVGGTTTDDRNIIVGNIVNGISLGGTFASGNIIRGNYIGVGTSLASIPNGANGIQISANASNNSIGGTGVTPGMCNNACNIISNNGAVYSLSAKSGIYVESTAGIGNSIRGNSVYTNGTANSLGIDLGTVGTTANDANDADTGANDLQNFPVISTASTSGVITGTLTSSPSTTYAIDFYRNTVADSSTGQARTYIGSTSLTTNSGGVNSFIFASTVALAAGEFITATATVTASTLAPQSVGDTSELSASRIVSAAQTTVSISGTITKNNAPLQGVTVTLSGSASATTTTNASGQYAFTGLMTGGSYLVTPTLAGNTFEPNMRSYSNVTTDITNADFTATDSNSAPRTLRVVNTNAFPGQPVTVPINLDSLGNEQAFSFSLSYDTSKLSNPQVACGSDAPGCIITTNTGTAGAIGIVIDNVTFTAGTKQLITVTFNTTANPPNNAANTPVGFTDTPTPRSVSNGNGDLLSANYVNGLVVFVQNYECDVAGRFTGDGDVLSNDLIIMRQFAARNITANDQYNEFQRADCAPRATNGDGMILSNDLLQARRYVARTDALQPAAGPTSANSPSLAQLMQAQAEEKSAVLVKPNVRIVSQKATRGATVTVPVIMDVASDIQAFGLSISFDKSKLTYLSATIGSGLPAGAVLTLNTNESANGRLGILVDAPIRLAIGSQQVVLVKFAVSSKVREGSTEIAFSNDLTPGSTSDSELNLVSTTYSGGVVEINAKRTPANVSGRVIASNGKAVSQAIVSLTDANGVTRTAQTNSFGYYSFIDVNIGDYTITAKHRLYRFEKRTITVNETIDNLQITSQQ